EATHSECLELVAKAFGYDNWNILSAKIEAAQSRDPDGPALPPAGAYDPVLKHGLLLVLRQDAARGRDADRRTAAACHLQRRSRDKQRRPRRSGNSELIESG